MLGLHRGVSGACQAEAESSRSACVHALDFRHRVGGEVVIPVRVAYVLLGHHTVPFSPGHHLVVVVFQFGVALETGFHLVRPDVGCRVTVLVEVAVHSLGVVHFIYVAHGLDREENELLVGIAVLRLEREILSERVGLKALEFVCDLLELPCLEVIGPAVQHLGSDPPRILAVEVEYPGRLLCLGVSELLAAELYCMVEKVGGGEFLRIAGDVHV